MGREVKVLKGFSEELQKCQWAKADVELDSTDLEEMLLEHQIDVHGLTVSQKYAILSTEAEKLLTVEYIRAVKTHQGAVSQALMDRLEVVRRSASEALNTAKKAASAG